MRRRLAIVLATALTVLATAFVVVAIHASVVSRAPVQHETRGWNDGR